MSLRVFISCDATSVALGADKVAEALLSAAHARGIELALVRTGSRGAFWLEPLVEVQTDQGRIGYGPVRAAGMAALVEAIVGDGAHPARLGAIADIPWLKNQTRISFARCGVVDPLSTADYRAHGGLAGLRKALAMTPQAIVAAVTESGLRGRGGAGFPAGIKWRTALEAPGDEKFVVCNADEGDSGTFADRILMEGDPLALIEGMVIAGLAIGAQRGFIYLRSEYPHAWRTLNAALARARRDGWLGRDIAGSGRNFDIEARLGAGAYICGEETALLESLEGKRGQVRFRPPLPAHHGLFAKPTVINNVLTLAAVPSVLAQGAPAYAALGSGRSRGTQPFQLAGNVKRGGLIELPFGVSLRTLIDEFGGGTRSGRPVRAVQVGGPLGAYLPPALLGTPLDYEALAGVGGLLGHGGVVVFDDSVDMAAQARFAMEFCAAESCGKCTPCRIGAVRGMEVIDRMVAGHDRAANRALLDELCETMTEGSLCALGGLTPLPVQSALKHFPDDFEPARAAVR